MVLDRFNFISSIPPTDNKMRNRLLTQLLIFFFIQSGFSQNDPCVDAESYHIVVLGSSTGAGAGASHPDSAWVNRYRTFLQNINPENEVTNLAVGGFTTYRIMPDGFVPPAGRPAPNTNQNITRAINLEPDGIIVNLPSNDVSSGFSVAEQLANFDTIVQHAANANIPIWICTTQPKNYPGNAVNIQKQLDVRDSILVKYAPLTLDFWTGLADATDQIDPMFDSGDGTHLNDAGHALLFGRAAEAYLPAVLFEANTTAPDYQIFNVRFLDPPVCGQTMATVRAVFYNKGLDGGENVELSLNVFNTNTGVGDVFSESELPSLATCAFDSLDFTIPVSEQGFYEMNLSIAAADDGDSSNNSSVLFFDIPGVPFVETFDEMGCTETSILLGATAEAGDSIRWWDAPMNGNVVGGGAFFETPVLSQSTTYYAETVRGDFFYKNDLTASENFNIYWNGAMFDLVASADGLVIDSLSLVIAEAGSQWVEIYTYTGSHIGVETNFDAWQYQGEALVQVVDSTLFVTISTPELHIPANDTTAIYLQLKDPNARLGYQWMQSPVTVSSPELTLIAGSGADPDFGGNYYPRYWAGQVHYHFGVKPDGDCSTERMPAEAIIEAIDVSLGTDTILDLSQTLTLDAGNGFTDYQWSDGSTGQTLDLSGDSLGMGIYTYSVVVINDLGCEATDEIIVVFAPLNSIAEEGEEPLHYFPNPTDDWLNVELTEGDWQLDISTSAGQTVHSHFYEKQNSAVVKVDVSALPAGFYILKTVKNGQVYGAYRLVVF